MPITTATAPPNSADIARRSFGALRRAQGLAPKDTEAGGGSAGTLHAPLAVYYLDADTLANNPSPTQARQVGWRYLVNQGDSVEAVELLGDQVSSITQGEVPAHLAQAMAVAEHTVNVWNDYEARILLFGRAGDSLLWLHASADGQDRFFSLSADPGEVDEDDAMRRASAKARMRQRLSKPPSEVQTPGAEPDESGG
jgi:hypothetical protein